MDRVVKVAGMIGLVLLGMVMGGVGYGMVSDEFRPTVVGDYAKLGLLTGNEFYAALSKYQEYYVLGVVDAFYAVSAESGAISEQSATPVPGLYSGIQWSRMDPSIKTQVGWWIAASKVHALLFQSGSVFESSPNNNQMADVVRSYIESHPTERQNNAALLVWRALAESEWK